MRYGLEVTDDVFAEARGWSPPISRRGVEPSGAPSTRPGLEHARPYDLRHSFASLLLQEGRSVIYVARQLATTRLTLDRYGHVMDELEGAPQVAAEAAIQAARDAAVPVSYPRGETAAG